SESQERMLMVLQPGREAFAKAIFDKWHLDFAVIGHLTDTQRMELVFEGESVADMPLDSLADDAPVYNRPHTPTAKRPLVTAEDVAAPCSTSEALLRLMGSADLASRRWIWEQYDHMVMGDTIGRPGGDAAVVRIHGTDKALAITTDVTPRYCEADPVEGGKQAVIECWRNLTAVGAEPLAITDCLNFGNPERPDIMGTFVGAIKGMGEACSALTFPVVSGNVSLYNETNGQAILPTPAIGAIGLLKDASKRAHIALSPGLDVVVIGGVGTHLGASLYLRTMLDREDGAPPSVDLEHEKAVGDFVRQQIAAGIRCVHDVSDGGLLVALTEMALAGDCGIDMASVGAGAHPHAFWFGEDQGRYVLACENGGALVQAAQEAGLSALVIGRSITAEELKMAGGETMSLEDIKVAHEGWLPALMQ
ncbi:MAG: AIR synthase-related protein, partial [Pseudomonadota bacterium]